MSSPFASSYHKNANTSCNKLLQAIAEFQRGCSEHLGWLETQQLSEFRYQMFVEQLMHVWKTYTLFFHLHERLPALWNQQKHMFHEKKMLIRIYQEKIFIKIRIVCLKHCDLNLHNHVYMQSLVYIIRHIFTSKWYSDQTFPG